MKALYNLRDTLCEELEKIAKKGSMSAGDLEMTHKITDTIKNIDKICMIEETGYSEDGYSRDGSWRATMDGNYGHGSSYARRRDSMGRYSRDGEDYSRTGNSYGNGSSYGGSSLGILEDMLRKADSPREREAIERCMREMRG